MNSKHEFLGTYRKYTASEPAAPVVNLLIGRPADAKKLDGASIASVEAVLDTGAGTTCIPREVARLLGRGLRFRPVQVRTASGLKLSRALFLEVEAEGLLKREIFVIELESDLALVGRDLLNLKCVILDGLQSSWQVHSRSTGGEDAVD